MDDKSLYSGLIRLHILHHAAEEPLYGVWIAEELARHGYKLSAGTLYPILHGLENKGYLRSHLERNGKSGRRVYEITPFGRKVLRSARRRVRPTFRGNVWEETPSLTPPGHGGSSLGVISEDLLSLPRTQPTLPIEKAG